MASTLCRVWAAVAAERMEGKAQAYRPIPLRKQTNKQTNKQIRGSRCSSAVHFIPQTRLSRAFPLPPRRLPSLNAASRGAPPGVRIPNGSSVAVLQHCRPEPRRMVRVRQERRDRCTAHTANQPHLHGQSTSAAEAQRSQAYSNVPHSCPRLHAHDWVSMQPWVHTGGQLPCPSLQHVALSCNACGQGSSSTRFVQRSCATESSTASCTLQHVVYCNVVHVATCCTVLHRPVPAAPWAPPTAAARMASRAIIDVQR